MGNRLTGSPSSANRAPTLRDVARRAGVSVATVSYVLSGRRDRVRPVTDETRDRILAAVAAVGYQRNHAGRSLRRNRTELVGVVYPPPDSPWLGNLMEQLHSTAILRRHAVISLPVGPDDNVESALRVLREHYLDGAILAPEHYLADDEIDRLAQHGLALVVFDDRIEPKGFDVVRLGEHAACYAAVRHLIERGHRRIAYLAHPNELTRAEGAPRLQAYRDALADHDVAVDESLIVPGAHAREEAYATTQALLGRPNPPTAVFSASDRGAINAVWAVRDLGLDVPGDVAVVGVGNSAEGAAIVPSLTTAGPRSIGFGPVIDLLWRRVEDVTAAETELHTPWELIIRDSS